MLTPERMALLKASRELAHTANPPGEMYTRLMSALQDVIAADTGIKVQFVLTGELTYGSKPVVH